MADICDTHTRQSDKGLSCVCQSCERKEDLLLFHAGNDFIGKCFSCYVAVMN